MNDDRLIIKETVDGRAARPASSPSSATPSSTLSASADLQKKRIRTLGRSARTGRPKSDPYIWGTYLFLLVISVIEIFSASSSEVQADNIYGPLQRQGFFLLAGLFIVLGLQRVHYGYFSRFAWFAALVSLALLIFSSFFGAEINGAQRAIKIGSITIQPPEIVKLTVVLLLATILGRNQRPGGVTTVGIVTSAIVVVVFGAVLWINGLTNMLILMLVSISMFLIGGIPWSKFFAVLTVYAIAGGALYGIKYMHEGASEFDEAARAVQNGQTVEVEEIGRAKTHKSRVSSFLEGVSPTDTVTDSNRQVFFAKMAQARGGLKGQGPGNSRESARLPLAFSDYIYSIIVEDAGFIGGVFLLILYMTLLGRAGYVAWRCKRAFPAFLIMGCAVLIVCQALVHMAIVTGVFPVSGQPLPLISKGGTSIIVMSAAIGIMLSVSRFAVKTTDNNRDNKAELKELPEDMQAANLASNV